MIACFTHTCHPSVRCGLLLTSCSSSGSIIGASSALGERTGDEESLFSHSVRPGVLLPVSRNERFSSLMLVWCLTISAGDVVSYSSRSTTLQEDEPRSCTQGTMAMHGTMVALHIQWMSKKIQTKITKNIHFIPSLLFTGLFRGVCKQLSKQQNNCKIVHPHDNCN